MLRRKVDIWVRAKWGEYLYIFFFIFFNLGVAPGRGEKGEFGGGGGGGGLASKLISMKLAS